MTTVAVSGYFDPLHVGHIEYLKAASRLGAELIVILNNDHQATLKKGKPFMRAIERAKILSEIRGVTRVVISFDTDETVRQTLEWVHPTIFAKGGDSTLQNVAERLVCESLGIKLLLGVGGDKVQSSSTLLGNYL